jgi:hypothetical protein
LRITDDPLAEIFHVKEVAKPLAGKFLTLTGTAVCFMFNQVPDLLDFLPSSALLIGGLPGCPAG